MNNPPISIIVALDEERGIGKQNGLLWHISEDLRHFKSLTAGHAVIMGRKTYESIGRPLPNRTNIVVTSHDLKTNAIIVKPSLVEAISFGSSVEKAELCIIGGGQIYAQALELADRLYITMVKGTYNAEIFFPPFDHLFHCVSEQASSEGEYQYVFTVWERKKLSS